MMNENVLKNDMRQWFKQIANNNLNVEEQMRQHILENKALVRNINKLFKQRNITGVKRIISNHIQLKLLNITYEQCQQINVVKKEDAQPKCIKCKHILTLPSKQIKSSTRRKCMYCNNDVAPFAKTVCVECYNQVEVEYDW